MSKKDYGKSAITAILGGYIVSIAFNNILFQFLGTIISLLGFICAFVWLYRVIKKQK